MQAASPWAAAAMSGVLPYFKRDERERETDKERTRDES